jgi:hypothetical protein
VAFGYSLSEALCSHHESHGLVPRVPILVRPVQNRLQLLLHSQSSQFTSPQLDRQWKVYDWLRSSKVLLPPFVFWQRRWHCPLPAYMRASLEYTAGLIPFEVFRATAREVLVYVATHKWSHLVFPALEHHVCQVGLIWCPFLDKSYS